MVNSEQLIATTELLTLWTRCRINRCRYKRVRLYLHRNDRVLLRSVPRISAPEAHLRKHTECQGHVINTSVFADSQL
jgi:hypothetical protein